MDARKQLHEWMLNEGFSHNHGDNSYSRPLSATFSLEVDQDMSMSIVCCADASETGVEHIDVNFELVVRIFIIERGLSGLRTTEERNKLLANLGAAMKMLEKIP